MNYVPVVVVGTSSTNISGTKDVASQDVKKDVSSLRYIALPNWFHEAYMETSNVIIRNSDAPDDCNADVPESSGSPIPIVCLDITPEISSGSRLISKRVFSQKEIPSLGNALTLSKSAFLYGTIDDDVYVMQPPGFQDPKFPDRVYKVEKDMYGLHQAPRAWYDGFFLSQDKYVGDILKKFGYSDVRSANTPMDKENPWGKDGPGKDVELHLYRSMIGSLMYLTASRPDIMFVVCVCARHQVTPKECHLYVVKRIFRYLK
nr:hypothetical protein [Tanacetum cinerariifolium]